MEIEQKSRMTHLLTIREPLSGATCMVGQEKDMITLPSAAPIALPLSFRHNSKLSLKGALVPIEGPKPISPPPSSPGG